MLALQCYNNIKINPKRLLAKIIHSIQGHFHKMLALQCDNNIRMKHITHLGPIFVFYLRYSPFYSFNLLGPKKKFGHYAPFFTSSSFSLLRPKNMTNVQSNLSHFAPFLVQKCTKMQRKSPIYQLFSFLLGSKNQFADQSEKCVTKVHRLYKKRI